MSGYSSPLTVATPHSSEYITEDQQQPGPKLPPFMWRQPPRLSGLSEARPQGATDPSDPSAPNPTTPNLLPLRSFQRYTVWPRGVSHVPRSLRSRHSFPVNSRSDRLGAIRALVHRQL